MLESILFGENFENELLIIGFFWVSSAHKFSPAKMASEVQKPLAKMQFLLVSS